MANISVQGLLEQKRRQFRTDGAGSRRFELDFTDALNMATSSINVGADLASRILKIADASSDTTINLSDDYIDIVSKLLTIELIELGQRPASGQEDDFRDLARQKNSLINRIAFDLRNQSQASDTDDESAIAQLGGLSA